MAFIRLHPPNRTEILQAHAFHRSHVGEFLFPRRLSDFKRLASDYSLVVATRADALVGLCYVTEDADSNRWEFGGVIVTPDQRGNGVASALGTVSIANAFLQHGETLNKLIAHVHVDNNDPRRLLTSYLGFVDTGRIECLKDDQAPASMRRNEHDEVCGNVFKFQRRHLATFADRIESGIFGKAEFKVDFLFMKAAAENAAELRTLAVR